MSRRVYIARRFIEADQAEAVAQRLRMEGHATTSRWHLRKEDSSADKNRAERQRICAENHADLRAADTLIAFAHPECRGTLVEVMAAYGLGHRVIVVGSPFDFTLMLELKDVVWVTTLDEAIGLLRTRTR